MVQVRSGYNGRRNAIAVEGALRDQVAQVLELLSRSPGAVHAAEPAADDRFVPSDVQEAIGFFGQVLAAWPHLEGGAVPERGAGFGSAVEVEDLDGRFRETYALMTGPLIDLDAGQVSLASPIGQALIGAEPGAVVTAVTPQRTRRLRVLSVQTLRDRVRQHLQPLSVA